MRKDRKAENITVSKTWEKTGHRLVGKPQTGEPHREKSNPWSWKKLALAFVPNFLRLLSKVVLKVFKRFEKFFDLFKKWLENPLDPGPT